MHNEQSDILLHYERTLENRIVRLKRTISIMAVGLILVSAVAVLEFIFIH